MLVQLLKEKWRGEGGRGEGETYRKKLFGETSFCHVATSWGLLATRSQQDFSSLVDNTLEFSHNKLPNTERVADPWQQLLQQFFRNTSSKKKHYRITRRRNYFLSSHIYWQLKHYKYLYILNFRHHWRGAHCLGRRFSPSGRRAWRKARPWPKREHLPNLPVSSRTAPLDSALFKIYILEMKVKGREKKVGREIEWPRRPGKNPISDCQSRALSELRNSHRHSMQSL